MINNSEKGFEFHSSCVSFIDYTMFLTVLRTLFQKFISLQSGKILILFFKFLFRMGNWFLNQQQTCTVEFTIVILPRKK